MRISVPFQFPNGSEYQLLLLDTNVLSNIVKNKNHEFENLIQRFLCNNYVLCFSFQSIIEIRKSSLGGREELYKSFIELFSNVPCLMVYPYRQITNQEIENFILRKSSIDFNKALNAFSPLGKDDSYIFDKWVDRVIGELESTIKIEEKEIIDTASTWNLEKTSLKRRHQLMLYPQFEKLFFRNFFATEKPEINSMIYSPNDFPAVKAMCITKYDRMFKMNKAINVNDVYDVIISAAIPYMDAVIMEKHQIDVLRQNQSKLSQLGKVKRYTLANLRQSI